MVLTHFGPSRPQFGSFITLCEGRRGLGACKGGLGDLAVFGRRGVKNDPKKKDSKRVGGYFWGVFMMFSDGFDAFWYPRPQFGSLIFHQVPSTLHEGYLGT